MNRRGLYRWSCIVLLGVVGCDARESKVRFGGEAMGTTWQVTLVGRDADANKDALRIAVVNSLADVESVMSHWRSDSEVSRFNNANSTEPQPIPRCLAEVVAEALRIGQETNGAFDITAAPLVALWGFGPEGKQATPPGDERVRQTRQAVGSGHLELDQSHPSQATLRKRIPELQIDLSALAKGYAIDEIARLLEAQNVENYLIELGGELKAGGGPHGETAWRVGLEVPDPHLVGAVRRTISLQDQAVATSGGYRHFYSMDENQVIHHIIDPRTGRPVDHGLVSVSVICDSAMRADALATALMVLGPLRGYEFAVENNLVATLVWRTGGELREQSTPAFESCVP